MMKGEPVIVEAVKLGTEDEFGEPTSTVADLIEVSNVLVKPGPTEDIRESMRDGERVAYTLYWPKATPMTLDDLRIQIRGEWCSVIGAPRAFDVSVCPTDWNMVVEVELFHG